MDGDSVLYSLFDGVALFFEGGGGAQILHRAGEERGGKEGATLIC